MEDEKDRVIKDIRACLVSTKQMLSLRQLEKDYFTMIGNRIPYRKLGFNNLQDFINSEPSLIIKTRNNEIFVDAQRSEKSSHISDLVQKQKAPKKRGLQRNTTQYAPPPRMTQTTRWRPKYVVHDTRKYQRSNRPAAVSHNQFVNKPSVPSKVVIPEHSGVYFKPNIQSQTKDTKSKVSSRLNIGGSSTVKASKDIHSSHIGSIDNSSSRDETLSNPPCSSLTNTKKRITKKMSEVSLERDSGNSSPTELTTTIDPISFPVIPKIPDPTGNFKQKLENLVEFYKIEKPIYEVKKIKTKQNNFCSCILKIGKHTYHSYPEDFSTSEEAEKYCAGQALQNLPTIYDKKRSLLLTNDKDILERIPSMLEKHDHGIWDWQLKLDYRDKYNEELPNDWLKIIDKSPCIQLEKCADNYVVRHCKPGDKGLMRNTMMILSDVSVPSNTVQFGDDSKLSAEITCIMSANEIWCRQHSTEETMMYHDMMTRMELYYERYGKNIKAETVTMGAYYVTNYDNAWYRVRTLEADNSEVQCFFIDYGDELCVPKSDLYLLKREFATAQAQAFVCRLVGLEDLYEVSQNSEQLQTILFSNVLLELDTDAKNIDGDLTLPVYMYDVDTGESINEKMILSLSMESANPELSKDIITEVYVSNIESNGDVYIQLHSTGYEKLQVLLEKLEADILSNPPTNLIVPIKKEESLGKLYFAKYESDDHWYRIQIIDWSPCETLAQIYFVDYGNTDVIAVNKEIIYPLESLSDVLNLYPPQAVRVKMAINEIPEDFIELTKKAIPDNEAVLLKVISYNDHLIPQVEFFKRNVDGGLFCINKSISMESELRKSDSNNNSKKRNRLLFDSKNVPSSGRLQSPTLPSKGDYFEVHVPFAVNPYNFFVQPLKTLVELNEMMDQLQERYKNIVYSPLTADQVIHGNIYASKHEDGNWYRTSVIKVIHPGSISVFYCDFGYYANLTVQQLIPLDIEFMQLPYQALKAKIANIKPKQSQWTMNDCDNFREMVEGNNFFSILLEIERDELYEEDLVLSLILIDTSSPVDVLIGDELIKKDVAVAAKK